MRTANLISGAILFAVVVVTLFIIIPQQTSPGLGYGLPPGFLPSLSAIIIGGLSIILFLKSIFRNKQEYSEPSPIISKNWLHLLVFSVLIFFALGSIKVLGFIPGGSLMIASFMIYMGNRRPLIIILVSLITPTVVHLIAWYAFLIPMP